VKDSAFREAEGEALELIADLSARRLDDLEQRGRHWWNNSQNRIRQWLADFLGPEHTWWKAGSILGALVMAFLLFWPLPHRIKGDFTLMTEALINLPAPYDGFLESVEASPVMKFPREPSCSASILPSSSSRKRRPWQM
jgi:hypothetical protein